MHLPPRLARSLAPSHCSRPCLSWGTRGGQTPGGCGGPAALGDGTRGMGLGPPRPPACGRESRDLSRAPFPRRRGSSCGAAPDAPERAPGSVPGGPLLVPLPAPHPAGIWDSSGANAASCHLFPTPHPKAHRCSPQARNLQDSSLPGFKCTFVPSQSITERQC